MFRLGYFILLLFTANTKISYYFPNTKIKAVKKMDSLPGGRFD